MGLIRKLSEWYFSRKALPYMCILAMDCVIVIISSFAVFYLQYGPMSTLQHFWPMFRGLAVSIVVFIILFSALHTFRGVMRYSSFVDLHRLALSTAISCITTCLLHQLQVVAGLTPYIIFPRTKSAIFIFIISTCLMWALRIFVKMLYDTVRTNSNMQDTFIYGCKEGGMALAKSIRSENPVRFNLVGFISGEPAFDGSWLLGVQVHYDDDKVLEVMRQKNVTALLVSPLQVERFIGRTSFVDSLIEAGIKIHMMPQAEEWDGKSDLSHKQFHEVEIEDLLPRQKIEVNMEAIGAMLHGKRILITGAAGSIGSEMVYQVARFQPAELVLVDQAETPMHDMRLRMAEKYGSVNCFTIVGSIADPVHMEKLFAEHRPEYVFHAAAYKHVPMMEDNPVQAVRNNVYGTRVVADLAVKYGTRKFVMISTDKAVNPTNVMGCSKRICEIYCQALNAHQSTTQFVTTRFGNVLGSNGSVIPIFREQIKRGGPVMVTHPDIIRYFMLIPEACRLVLEAGTIGKGGEIFVFNMGEPVKIVDLARRMISLSGAKNVRIEYSGLRPGEKLYEELLASQENIKPTVHPKIMVAQVREYPYDLALRNEEELLELSKGLDDMAIVRKMKEIVPEFKSHNSRYEELDSQVEKG